MTLSQILQPLYAELLPVFLQIIAAVLGFVILRAAEAARRRWNIEIEARHREALHRALMSGISAAMTRGLRGSAVIDPALAHARASVPDALAALQPEQSVLLALAAAKLREAAPPVYMGFDLGHEPQGGVQ